MEIRRLLGLLKSSRSHQYTRPRSAGPRLSVEALEDRSVPASLSIGDVTVMEGTSGVSQASVVVTLSEASTRNVTVNYATANLSALAGSDYDSVSGKLTFAKGQTSKTILVPIRGDQVPEWNETFSIRLSGAKGATIADGQGIVTIQDSSPRLTVSREMGDEGTTFTFTVTLSRPLTETLTVDYFTEDGSEGPGAPWAAYMWLDYVPVSGTLTFAPGETTTTFTVDIVADDEIEYDEVFAVTLVPSLSSMWVQVGYGEILGELGEYI
jgi:chitinase